MYFIDNAQSIATIELNSYLERQVNAIAPEPIRVYTPQRRANYNDKARLRRKDLKEVAFKTCGWKSTANIKKYLKVLGTNLDLRLTSAWNALLYELKSYIDTAKAIVDALEKPKIPTTQELLDGAVENGAIADWKEIEEGGLYWIGKTPHGERELVTSSGLAMYLRQLE